MSWVPGIDQNKEIAIKYNEGNLDLDSLCGNTVSERFICFTPEPMTTLGEILELKDLSDAYGWESIVIVTSRYHVFRTSFIAQKCFPSTVEVDLVAAPIDLSIFKWIWHITYENLAFVKAMFQTNSVC